MKCINMHDGLSEASEVNRPQQFLELFVALMFCYLFLLLITAAFPITFCVCASEHTT